MNKKFFLVLLILLFLLTSSFSILLDENIKIFAVTEDQRGIVADLHLYTIPGSGDVAFITSNSLVGKDTQTTGNIAVKIASEKSGIEYTTKNFIFDIKANASEVDGPSAGAAMALITYAVLSEKRLNPKVGITGTINTDGSIGSVGGIGAKAIAASKDGIELFMIPTGTANQPVKGEDGKTTYENLLIYGPEKLKLKVVEVDTIDDAINFAYSNIENITVDPEDTSTLFVPVAVKYPTSLDPMKDISLMYIKRAKESISEAKKELEITELSDEYRSSFYPQLGIAERNVEMAQIYLDQNYLYSAANYSFNARVMAGSIKEIAINPSLLSKDSKILELKIESLKKDIKNLKLNMQFIPINNYEWMIGAQQRIAYSENALNNIEQMMLEIENFEEDEESAIMFNVIYELDSAQAWFEVATDFFNEAKKDPVKKVPKYSSEFIENISSKIKDLNTIITDSNFSATQLYDPLRRFNSAKISFESKFYFAALYDVYFAESALNSEFAKTNLTIEELYKKTNENLSQKEMLTSIWSNMFIDHAFFYLENAKFSKDSGKILSYESNLKASFELSELSKRVDSAKFEIDKYLSENNFEDYIYKEGTATVEITYNQKELISPILSSLIIVLLCILLVVIFIGFNSSRRPYIKDATRAEKLDLLLHRLDKALSSGKVNEAEYFFLKKKYEDEFNLIKTERSERSKIVLDLNESRAKLSALQQGLKDLNKHYKSGLIIPEDYERSLLEVKTEINSVKSRICDCENDLRTSRRLVVRRLEKKNEGKLKGTEEIAKDEKELERLERNRRKSLIDAFKNKKK